MNVREVKDSNGSTDRGDPRTDVDWEPNEPRSASTNVIEQMDAFFSIHQRQQVRNNTKTPTQKRSGSSRMSQEPTFSGKFHFHRKKVIARITAALSADPEQRFLNCAKKKEKSLALDRWEISPHQGGDRRTSVKSWYEVEIRAEEMWNCRKWYAWNLPQLTKEGRRGKRDGGVGCVVWFGVRYEEKGGQGKRGRQKDMRGRGGMSNWYNDQQWWGEEGVKRQRTAERERGRVWHRHRRLTGVQEGEEEEVGKLN